MCACAYVRNTHQQHSASCSSSGLDQQAAPSNDLREDHLQIEGQNKKNKQVYEIT